MRYSTSVLLCLICLVLVPRVMAQDEFPPCIPLNEELSICTNVEGLSVSFVDASYAAAMGGVSLRSLEKVGYTWAVYWEVNASLDDYSKTQMQGVMEYKTDYELQDRVTMVVEGFDGVRYDLLPKTSENEGLPQSVLFLETPGGIAILSGYALEPGVEISDIHAGAISATRILKIGG